MSVAFDHQIGTAAEFLQKATDSGQVHAAALCVRQGSCEFARAFGQASSPDALFLLASISKTISAAAVMKLYEWQKLCLDDPVRKFIPEFKENGRDQITVAQLLTHVSGLPDQLPRNAELRARHATLAEFVEDAIRTPLLFEPGTRYNYSSMAILLATEVAQRIAGATFSSLVDELIYQPLALTHSALGIGHLDHHRLLRVQTENAAPESGGGAALAKDWDWNSNYWRTLGAPWGGAHGSVTDVANFLTAFLPSNGRLLSPATARLMTTNRNGPGIRPRGLGFDIGTHAGGQGLCPGAFGHEGSTGTICWADPATDTVCVVLTTLPLGAATPHPCLHTSDLAAALCEVDLTTIERRQ